jgi:hypothetical protein
VVSDYSRVLVQHPYVTVSPISTDTPFTVTDHFAFDKIFGINSGVK